MLVIAVAAYRQCGIGRMFSRGGVSGPFAVAVARVTNDRPVVIECVPPF